MYQDASKIVIQTPAQRNEIKLNEMCRDNKKIYTFSYL